MPSVKKHVELPGLEIKCVFFRGAQWHLQKLLKDVMYRNQYIFAPKLEGATGEFKGALGSRLLVISSPDYHLLRRNMCAELYFHPLFLAFNCFELRTSMSSTDHENSRV